jgi:hypothetical protein
MNNELKVLGDKILYEEGLYNILSKLGEPQIVGSFDLDLLIKPDIDITIKVEKYDTQKYFLVCTEIADKIKPIRIKYIDQSVAQFDAFPFDTGYFLGINLKRNNIKWSIDAWIFTPEIFKERIDYHNEIKKSINDSNRDVLMNLKRSVFENPNYRSVDLYRAVLFDGIESLDDFDKWYKGKYLKDFS